MNKKSITNKAKSNRKAVIELSNSDAKSFFLKAGSFCRIDLPSYLNFDDLLIHVDTVLKGASGMAMTVETSRQKRT